MANLIQHVSTQPIVTNQVAETGNNYVVTLPNTSLSGNTLVMVVAYPSGSTPSISDDKSNTWPASGAAGTVTVDAGGGNMAMQAFVLNSATTGTQAVTVNFGSTAIAPVRC